MVFYDKNGEEISLGDHVIPDEGRELVIIGEKSGEVSGLLGEQIVDPTLTSLLTQADLSRQWSLKE